ncbi:MAG: GNAT family N-acetyltransferase [Bacteroidales bacterium]|jgi:GNAT superfamily N-acetyltransferase|nr:GNAT family N-acetyltransferase [Bacteroidales bacterium]
MITTKELKRSLKEKGFIPHFECESWGSSILIMRKDGKAFCRMYRYTDDPKTVYFSSLSVDESVRRRALGTKILKAAEEIAASSGAKALCLSADRTQWMHAWYQRSGFVDFADNRDAENSVWMQKAL